MTAKTFLFAWEGYQPQPDPLMTIERANRLIRAWRGASRAKVNGRPTFTIKLLRHMDGWREYQVASKYGERGSLWVRTANGSN